MDYDGLSTLLVYHNYMALNKKIYEEKTWLTQLKESHESLGISMEKIKKYFQTHVWSSKDYSPYTSI